MANNAFDAMNDSAGNDMYVTGGSITSSEYEQNMTPSDQRNYEDYLDRGFRDAYFLDPYKGNLDYKTWLKSLNGELLEERALDWEDIEHGKSIGATVGGTSEWINVRNYHPNMTEYGYSILKNAGSLQKLSHLHTGRIVDLIAIADSIPDTSSYGGEGSLGGRNRSPLGYDPMTVYPEGTTDIEVEKSLMPGQEQIIQQGR